MTKTDELLDEIQRRKAVGEPITCTSLAETVGCSKGLAARIMREQLPDFDDAAEVVLPPAAIRSNAREALYQLGIDVPEEGLELAVKSELRIESAELYWDDHFWAVLRMRGRRRNAKRRTIFAHGSWASVLTKLRKKLE